MLVLLCVFVVLCVVEALWEQTLEQFQTNIFLSNVDQCPRQQKAETLLRGGKKETGY
jgi:hypothetical protein